MSWIVPPAEGLIEPAMAPEIFADGIGAVEINNGCVRIYLFAEQMPLEASGGEPAKVVTAKVTGPVCSVPSAIAALIKCLMPQECERVVRGPWPHLVT